MTSQNFGRKLFFLYLLKSYNDILFQLSLTDCYCRKNIFDNIKTGFVLILLNHDGNSLRKY